MTSQMFLITCQIAVIACGLVSGVFLTFSDFVMKSLAAADPAGGVQSMQIINRKVYKTVFMALLLGMSFASPLFAGYAYFYVSGPAAIFIMTGSAIYFVGVFIVSLLFNVPMNKRLDVMDYNAKDTHTYWQTYVPVWSFWNYIRSISSAGAAGCFLVACVWLALI